MIERRWGHLENVEVILGDLEDPDLYAKLESPFDSIVSINVLEHLGHPETALAGFHTVLRPGGNLIVHVPAHQWLYSDADKALGHQRRFEARELVALLEGAGFEILKIDQFNRMAVAGWLFNKLFGSSELRRWQVRLFATLLPLARLVEHVRILPGLSFVGIARKR
jgi:SAM-dependent methyltransferase